MTPNEFTIDSLAFAKLCLICDVIMQLVFGTQVYDLSPVDFRPIGSFEDLSYF